MTVVATLTRIMLPMTAHASRHGQIRFPEQAIALGDMPVTILAFGAGLEMRLMAKKYKIRLFVDPNPWDFLFIAVELRQLLNRRTVFLDGSMTGHALGGRREAHGIARIGIRVAILTNKTERQMLLVTIRNRLLGSLGLVRKARNREDHECRCNQASLQSLHENQTGASAARNVQL